MSQDTKENKQPEEIVTHLGSKPQRQTRSGLQPLPIVIGVVLLIVVIGAVVLVKSNVFSTQSTTATNANPAPGAGSASSGGSKLPEGCTGARLPSAVVLQETANGLHMTVSAIQAEVTAGKTVSQVATAQQISANQLHDIEVNALQTANNQWVQKGCISQQDAANNMKRDTGTATYMDAEFTDRFKNP
ncbi:MAG TPA: hypothetical protein VL485_02775 [Ktedonobacteraceae bacterium]|jgi:hypothetical protein|nr:hypothetical protein [Ktedonobacteraceae bacterium]